jgi:predicted transcriptional regulator
MHRSARTSFRRLGDAEQAVMDHIWAHGPVTAEDCREALRERWPMKDSTMRTVLRRLETKGYLVHSTAGRTYIYRAAEAPAAVAARAVRHLIDRFCGGSAETLLVGLVRNDVLSPAQLERLTKKIVARKDRER